ncbi:MAG TPA: hypothetical protein VNN13_11170 [Methylomirabilota bacterium]|nr:hypothetical protein [Methylomirabilota bacterium]
MTRPATAHMTRSMGWRGAKRKTLRSDGTYKVAAKKPSAPAATHQKARLVDCGDVKKPRDQDRLT